jgi:biopolymer transport protein ExbD
VADPNDIPLSAGQRSRIRRLSAPKEPAPGEEAGELNIVPYLDIVMNIIVFVISTLSVVFMSTIDTQPPALPDPGKGSKTQDQIKSKALNLTALITSEGIGLKTSDGNVSTGCNSYGAGVAVPKVDGKHDFTELTRCAKELKKKNERAQTEQQVTITANPDIDYQTVIDTIGALRTDKQCADKCSNEPKGNQDGCRLACQLFPDVAFGVAK